MIRTFIAIASIALAMWVAVDSRSAEEPPAPAAGSSAETTPPSMLFIVHFSPGPAWVADKPFPEQSGAKDHSANLKRLRDAGALVVGARYADQGMIIIKAASEEEARAEIAKDSMVNAGTFAMTIAAFHPFYPGCVS